MLTFLDCQQDNGLLSVASACADTPRFAYLVNATVRRLMRRGDWLGTVTPIQVCVRNGCVVFPRYVGTIRKLHASCQTLTPGNLWHQYLDPRDYGRGRYDGLYDHRFQGQLNTIGQAVTYSDVWGEGRLIRAYVTAAADVGKTLTLFGTDNNGQPLTTTNLDGSVSQGVVITFASPFASTSMYVRSITRVRKDVTQGRVFLYGYNPAIDQGVAPNLGLEDLAIYDPTEINPTYVKYQLHAGHTPFGCNSGLKSIIALVKLNYIPVVADTDLVIIDNLDAIKYGMQSVITGESANGIAEAKEYEAAAVMELQRDLENAFPDDTFSAANRILGKGMRRNQCF